MNKLKAVTQLLWRKLMIIQLNYNLLTTRLMNNKRILRKCKAKKKNFRMRRKNSILNQLNFIILMRSKQKLLRKLMMKKQF